MATGTKRRKMAPTFEPLPPTFVEGLDVALDPVVNHNRFLVKARWGGPCCEGVYSVRIVLPFRDFDAAGGQAVGFFWKSICDALTAHQANKQAAGECSLQWHPHMSFPRWALMDKVKEMSRLRSEREDKQLSLCSSKLVTKDLNKTTNWKWKEIRDVRPWDPKISSHTTKKSACLGRLGHFLCQLTDGNLRKAKELFTAFCQHKDINWKRSVSARPHPPPSLAAFQFNDGDVIPLPPPRNSSRSLTRGWKSKTTFASNFWIALLPW